MCDCFGDSDWHEETTSSLLGTISRIWHYDMSVKALDKSAELKLTSHVQSSNTWGTYRKAMVISSLLALLLVTTSCALPIYNRNYTRTCHAISTISQWIYSKPSKLESLRLGTRTVSKHHAAASLKLTWVKTTERLSRPSSTAPITHHGPRPPSHQAPSPTTPKPCKMRSHKPPSSRPPPLLSTKLSLMLSLASQAPYNSPLPSLLAYFLWSSTTPLNRSSLWRPG